MLGNRHPKNLDLVDLVSNRVITIIDGDAQLVSSPNIPSLIPATQGSCFPRCSNTSPFKLIDVSRMPMLDGIFSERLQSLKDPQPADVSAETLVIIISRCCRGGSISKGV